jgi:hypothetical protein
MYLIHQELTRKSRKRKKAKKKIFEDDPVKNKVDLSELFSLLVLT